MRESIWLPEFERLLRAQLPFLPPDAPVPPHEPLSDLGLDSINVVTLLTELEDQLSLEFGDELLDAELFTSASTLWAVVDRLRQD